VNALQALGFDEGVIFMGGSETNLNSDWAEQTRLMSDVVFCFVPDGMSQTEASELAVPVLQWASSGKLICGGRGLPERLLTEVTIQDTIEDALQATWKMVAQGALRTAAERKVPLMIWRTPSWSGWYNNLVLAGNRLDGAKIEWSFRVGPTKAFVLFWSVHADIYVAAEDRNKSNEVVVSRPDIACVLAYLPGKDMLDTEIILIKEFRSPCCNAEMFVHELPGGSSFKPKSDFYQTAADELFEETGIKVAKDRLSRELSRQAVATVSTHLVHLFSCKLTKEEMDMARRNAKDRTAFGNASETEITYIVTMSLGEALESNALDFVTIGCASPLWCVVLICVFLIGMVMQTIGILYGHAAEAEARSAEEARPAEAEEQLKPVAEFGRSQKKSHTVAALASHWKSISFKRVLSVDAFSNDNGKSLVEEVRKAGCSGGSRGEELGEVQELSGPGSMALNKRGSPLSCHEDGGPGMSGAGEDVGAGVHHLLAELPS